MTEERAKKLLMKCENLRRKHLAPIEEIDMRIGMIHSECDSKQSNAYTRALVEAETQASLLPTYKDESGREMIIVEGKSYPRSWLIRTAARMKVNSEI